MRMCKKLKDRVDSAVNDKQSHHIGLSLAGRQVQVFDKAKQMMFVL